MMARRHPTAHARADHAAATLAPGAALAVAAHIEQCPVCSIGAEAAVRSGQGAREGAGAAQAPAGELRLPPALAAARLGRWRWLRPGVKVAALQGVSGLGEAAWLLKARGGAGLPLRRNRAVQQIVVLEGSILDDGDVYLSGDFVEPGAGDGFDHPSAARPAGCVCLIVTDASWPAFGLGRLRRRRG